MKDKTVKYYPLLLTFDERDAGLYTPENVILDGVLAHTKPCAGAYARGNAFASLYPLFDMMGESEDRKDIVQAWLIAEDGDGNRTVKWCVESPKGECNEMAEFDEVQDEFYHYQVWQCCTEAEERGDDISDYWYTNDAGERKLDTTRCAEHLEKVRDAENLIRSLAESAEAIA